MREWSLVAEEKRQWQDESAKIAVLVVERCTKQDKRFVIPFHQYSCTYTVLHDRLMYGIIIMLSYLLYDIHLVDVCHEKGNCL